MAGESANAIGCDCSEINMLAPFLKTKMAQVTMEGGLLDTNLAQVAIRAVYQYNKENSKYLHLVPLFIDDFQYTGFYDTFKTRTPRVIDGLSEKFMINSGRGLGIYLPDDAFCHTVCAQLLFGEIDENTTNQKIRCKVTVYDSLKPTTFENILSSYKIDKDRKDNQSLYIKYKTDKKGKIYEKIIKRCIIPGVAKRFSLESGPKIDEKNDKCQNETKQYGTLVEYSYTNSVLYQNNNDDSTCGINCFLC